jgi:hypothetical protein
MAPTNDEIQAADTRARHWRWPTAGRLRIGSARHRDAVCQMFSDTFNPYKPAVIDWPQLEPDTLQRLTSLPIWDIAVRTEDKARARMEAYGEVVRDSTWSDAIARNGWEEGRHRQVLSNLVACYGIKLEAAPPDEPPRDPEWGYLVTGYSECIDSFFAFGLFEVARRSGLFPPELINTFEPVIQEECRHILLFANWVAWHRAQLSWWRRVRFEAKVAAVWAFLGWERIGLARTLDAEGNEQKQDNNFTVNGAHAVSATETSVRELMTLCLQESERRFSGYDPRLLRPATMPKLVRLMLRFTRARGST